MDGGSELSETATVASMLAAAPGEATALALPSGEIAYAELRRRVEAAAAALAGAGIGHGSRVLIRSGDDVSRLLAILATQWIGGVAVPVNPAVSGSELEFLVSRSEPHAAIVQEGFSDDLALAPGVGVWVDDGDGELRPHRRGAGGGGAARAPAPDDPASILFTSGSSARPRGVVLSHRAHAAMGRDLAALMSIGGGDRLLALSPFFHVGGWSTAVMPALAAGAALVIPGPFSASRFWGDVERWRPTIWTTGLAFIEMVGARGGEPPAEIPFRHVISNLRPDTWELARRLGLPIGTYYGLTENDARGTFALAVTEYEAGFVGTPYTARDGLRVTVDGEPVPAGSVGEIEFRGECTMLEYFRDPEATAAVLRDGGWVATGDLGRIDAGGSLRFVGRIKNMIKRSGENVSAEEVELHLLAHPDVADVAVTAVPDRVREEEVKAIVVAAPGRQPTAEALHEHCLAGIAAFKVPRYFQFVDQLPHTISGKPDVATVRRDFGGPERSWDSLNRGGSE